MHFSPLNNWGAQKTKIGVLYKRILGLLPHTSMEDHTMLELENRWLIDPEDDEDYEDEDWDDEDYDDDDWDDDDYDDDDDDDDGDWDDED